MDVILFTLLLHVPESLQQIKKSTQMRKVKRCHSNSCLSCSEIATGTIGKRATTAPALQVLGALITPNEKKRN